jgi:hypothetical protein
VLSDFQDFSLISSDFQYRALANTLTPLNWLDTEMECRMKAVYIFIVTLWMMILPHHVTASDLDAVTKTQLQTTMITFLEAAADEAGAFGVIDRDTGVRVAVFPGAIHPRIVPYGADYFLCIEMFDRAGKKYDADFLIRDGSKGWMVVDVMMNQRDLLRKAIANSGS